MQPLDVQIERSENPRKMIVHQDMVTPIKLRR